MTAELEALEAHGPWTTDDLDELPESTRHHELIDGVLIVPPAPTYEHQTLILRLGAVLDESCPAQYAVTQGVEIRISRTRSLIPDVAVVDAEAAARLPKDFAPHEVVLAVEVLSPSSVTMDRITKRALYAQAGIPFYWVVELSPRIVVHTHRLDPGAEVYEPAGEYAERVTTAEPWSVDFPVSRLVPRHYRPGAQP